MNWSCLSGWTPISRGELHEMVRASIANEPKERQRLNDAQKEFYDRTKGVSQNEKHKIFKEVADKYGYREEYFIDKVNF